MLQPGACNLELGVLVEEFGAVDVRVWELIYIGVSFPPGVVAEKQEDIFHLYSRSAHHSSDSCNNPIEK